MVKLIKIGLILMILLFLVVLINGSPLEGSQEKSVSPSDRIGEDQIFVYKDKIVLDIKNASWARFTDTKSMLPILDKGANSIEVKPKNEEDVQEGDIISYETEEGLVVHRVVEIGRDEEGAYYIVKGDNNKVRDNDKVRFEQINGVLVALIY